MAKHRVEIVDTFHVPIDFAFEVEFDTETGESEVVGQARALSSPDLIRRRQVIRTSDPDDLDVKALSKLLDQGKIPPPKLNEEVMLHGEPHVMMEDVADIELEEYKDGPSGEDIVAGLSRSDRSRRRLRLRKKRSLRRRP